METAAPSQAYPPASSQRTWSARDIHRAVRLSFDVNKLAAAALGLTAAALCYGSFHWLGARTGERAAHQVFIAVGALLSTCLCMLFSGLVAKMTVCQLLQDRRAGAAELRQFVRERARTLVGIPLTFGGIALLVLGVEAMLAMVGSIPGMGPIVYSASFLMAFGLSMLAVLTAAVHFVGGFLYPTIVAVRGVGAIGAVMEVVDLARRKPLFILMYEGLVAAVGTLMAAILGGLVWAGLRVTVFLGGSIMEEKFDLILGAIPSFFQIFLRPFEKAIPLPPEPLEAAWHYELSGLLMGGSMMVVAVLVLVYPFTFFTSAGSITYLILRTQPELDGAAQESEPPGPDPIEDL